MRINRFEISAFGPFTGMVLDFSATGSDLHVIFGPNEAGKSSALRALKAWLFGFPERTRDDFLHPRNQLLVGGELLEGEETLTFFRRKKRKGDLVDADGNTLDPALLRPFLGGLDLALFEVLYGIDHDTLVRGGREILARQGEIGETLFSAGAGLGSLHRVLEEMEAEKNDLFRGRASKPRINQGLSLHKKLSKEIRELSLTPERWQEHADRFDQVSRELAEVTGKRLDLDRKRQHLERLHRAVPLLARRRKLLEQQQALGPFRPLPSDFSTTRSTMQQELRSAGQRLEHARARQQQISSSLKQLSPHKSLINSSSRIEDGFQRLGEYSKAKKDRPRLEGMRAVHLKEADRLLRTIASSLTLQQSEQLLPLVQQKRKILNLASRREALLQAQKDADSRLTTARRHKEKTEKQLAGMREPRDGTQLKMVVTRARKAGDIDNRIRELGQDYVSKEKTIQLRLRQVGRWQGTTAELLGLDLPLSQTIHLFRDELQELKREKEQLTIEAREIEDELLKLRTRQKELRYGGDIPREEELVEVRKRRDQGWQLICRNWLEQEDITEQAARYAPDAELHETVYDLILQADTISDRLRLEADRVHEFAGLQASMEELTTRLQQNNDRQQRLSGALSHHKDSWRVLWQPLNITPSTPGDMADWRAEMVQLQQLAMELEKTRKSIADLEKERNALQQQIRAELGGNEEGPELEPLLMAAETMLERLQAEREQFQELCRDQQHQEEQVRQAKRELDRIKEDLEEWQQRWQQTARVPGAADSFEPDVAQDLLDTVGRIFSILNKADELKSRMQGIDRDCLEFEEEIQKLVREVAPDLEGRPVTQCVQQLHDRLTAAGKEQALHEKYEKEAKELDREIRESELALAGARRELDKLLTIAGCKAEEELVLAEQNAADHRRLAEQIEQVEQDLQQIAGELSLEELAEQVQAVDSDSLPGELHALEIQITGELDPAIRALAEQKGEAKKMLEQMDGSELAARKAEDLENNLAELQTSAEQYLRLQVGVDMLRREIEDFRRQNQDPVLTIASRLFAELTLGSFSGLKTDVDDRGEPVLVGVRADNKQILGVESMSTGSRDQLYLSLRLAGLQHRAVNGQTMPFIVDDILINFDDARSAATLQVLAELGQSSQLILFTHHQQVAEQARSLDGVKVHQLTREFPAEDRR